MSLTPLLTPKYRAVSDTALTTEQFNQILCPNLRTGVRMSLINPDVDGWVAEAELRVFLEYIGLYKDSKVEDILMSTGKSASAIKREGHINIIALKGTALDHGSSSGILNNSQGFLSDRLELFKSYADDQGRLYKEQLALACNQFHQCPFHRKSFKGSNIFSFEIAGMLALYGRQDDSRAENYFSLADLEDLWQHNRFPEGWQVRSKPFYSTTKSFLRYLGMMWQRIRIGWTKTAP